MNVHTSQTDYLLSLILRSTQNAETISAQAANNSAKAASNSAPRIGWVSAFILSTLLVVFVFPLCRMMNVPYVGSTLDKFTEYTRQLGEDTGILITEKIAYRQNASTWENGIHPDLMSVYHLANEYAHQDNIHIHIREGLRTVKRQARLFKSGFSATMNSRHLDGHALDLGYQYAGPQSNKKDWKYARIINGYMQKAAKQLGIRVEWGGHWKSFPDGFHWQLPWKLYPKTSSKKTHKRQIIVQPKQAQLTQENTEKLITAIIKRESSNDHTKYNKLTGMLGLCQFSAATLVEIGLIHRSAYTRSERTLFQNKKKTDKYRKLNYAAHKAFLGNNDNWILKGGKQQFMNSRPMQLKACKELIKLHTSYGKKSGAINSNSTQRRIAGYLFAAQFGHLRANDYYLRGKDSRDGNHVLTSTYASLGEASIKD